MEWYKIIQFTFIFLMSSFGLLMIIKWYQDWKIGKAVSKLADDIARGKDKYGFQEKYKNCKDCWITDDKKIWWCQKHEKMAIEIIKKEGIC